MEERGTFRQTVFSDEDEDSSEDEFIAGGQSRSVSTKPTRLSSSLSSRKGSVWYCPVCFYTNNPLDAQVCEICQSPNPER